MKVYLASAFKFRREVEHLADVLFKVGIRVTDNWWHVDFKAEAPDTSLFRTIAARHWAAIHACDALVLVNGDAELPHRFTGANVEVGYALALDKPVFTVGPMEVSAMYADTIRADSIHDLVYFLGILDHLKVPMVRSAVPS